MYKVSVKGKYMD